MINATTSRLTASWRSADRGDRRSVLWIVIVPFILFVVPALFNHPAIVGDNLIQNFPLRVLVGRQLASGHLPLMNPLGNAGTPLLGGLNAGAFYPLTLLFVFVTPIAAWIVNLIAVYVTAALGMYVLLRWHRLGALAAFVAAMSFTYTGAMLDQLVHLGVVQGFALLPWAVLIMLWLSRRLRDVAPSASWRRYARVALPGCLAYTALWGLTFLTGEPRAMAELELLTLIGVPTLLAVRSSYFMTTWRARITYVATLVVGLAWGVAIGLAQLLPGWSFISVSQRSSISYSYFGAGSLAVHWTPLLLIPDLFGGNGSLAQPGYFTTYNLAEVTGYTGIVALVACAGFLSRCTWRGWRGAERDYALYVVVGIVGLFATWGNNTPVGHIFRAIPLFGSTRLQSRNVILVDLAAAVLLGWWLERVRSHDLRGAGLEGRARWVTLAPAFAVVVFGLALCVWGPAIVQYLGTSQRNAHLANGHVASDLIHVAIALAIVVVLVWWRHSKVMLRVLLGALAIDIVMFMLLSATGLVGQGLATMPSAAAARALLGDSGRFALVDVNGDTSAFEQLGIPNLNVFTGVPSVQGYGSLVSTAYDNATGTHPQAGLDPCTLGTGTFAQLRLESIGLTPDVLLGRPYTSGALTSKCFLPKRRPSTQRYFGRLVRVASITIVAGAGDHLSDTPVSVRLLGRTGHLYGPTYFVPSGNRASVTVSPRHDLAAGFEVSSPTGVLVRYATVTVRGRAHTTYGLNSAFQLAMSVSSWYLTTTTNDFSIFRARHLLAPAWFAHPSPGSRLSGVTNATWGDSWITVHAAKPILVRRSFAYLPGWRATAYNQRTGQTRALVVVRHGLIQEVRVPMGDWRVHFHYHAPHIEFSLTTSIATSFAFVVVSVLYLLDRRRRRNGKVLS
jgi:uncharacterized membrane protein YidH (DUF202 family)